MRLPTILRLLALACLLPMSLQLGAADDCPKKVFGLYCLGEDTSTLTLTPKSDAEASFIDEDGNPNTVLEIQNDTLLAVERRLEPGGWREFDFWRKRLERIYRSGQDASTFPRYAASRSSRLNAIRSGRGSARIDWPQDGWTLSLIWREPNAVALRYALSDATSALSNDDL